MSRLDVIEHRFVDYIPSTLEEGVIYVSIPYTTATHKCCCGCGNKVVTPITPTDWKLIFNGKTISLKPSIGNWNLPCRSHYWVQGNKIRWAEQWSDEQVDRGRKHEVAAAEDYYSNTRSTVSGNAEEPMPLSIETSKPGFRQRVKQWWSNWTNRSQ